VLGLANPVAYAPQVEALRAGLRELGYAEGKNIVLEFRWADGHYDRLPALAAELVRLKVDVLVTHGAGSTAAKNATTTIPIVTYVGDAVSLGLAASLAEPGGNLTGSSFFGPEIGAKRLELIKETVAHAARVGAIINTAGTSVKKALAAMQVTAQHLKLALQMREVRNPDEIESAFKEMTRNHVDAIVVMDDPMLVANFKTIAALATKYKLPAIGFTGFAEAGGLMTSGVNLLELWHRHAYFVDKILKGVRPGVIPIEQPTHFELVVNMKTAKALGIKIPQSLLVQATKVIE
jgi:putative ABC transport system substrate-binding protein